MLKPQDILTAVGLQALLKTGQKVVTFPHLAALIRLSGSETHASIARLAQSQLLAATTLELRQPNRANFLKFAEHGLRYVYPPSTVCRPGACPRRQP